MKIIEKSVYSLMFKIYCNMRDAGWQAEDFKPHLKNYAEYEKKYKMEKEEK